ncbi:MAG: hypothetical protein VX336_01875, partial [Actinomycetota bacterium]|nr:hypothetical protein [Actinomycetota bacterium]
MKPRTTMESGSHVRPDADGQPCRDRYGDEVTSTATLMEASMSLRVSRRTALKAMGAMATL